MAEVYRLHTDGGARGNPGPAGIGVVLEGPDGELLEEIARGIGWATNNVAEYEGLVEGLKSARRHGAKRLHVLMDSVLVIEQMLGNFRVKHQGLKPLHEAARKLVAEFDEVHFQAIPREQNARADELMNRGIDLWVNEHGEPGPPPAAQPELF